MEAKRLHKGAERVAALAARHAGPLDGEKAAMRLRGLGGLKAGDPAEAWLGRALSFDECVDAVDELTVVVLQIILLHGCSDFPFGFVTIL